MCGALKVAGPVQYRNIMALAVTLGFRLGGAAVLAVSSPSPLTIHTSPHTGNFPTIMVIASLSWNKDSSS